MLNLMTKMSLVWLLSLNVSAAEPIEQYTVDAEHIKSCPNSFYSLPVLETAKFCQQFSTTLPASMSYFTANDQQTVKEFYITEFGQAENEEVLKGRIVLKYSTGNKIVIISADGHGSQIDMLVKSADPTNL